MLHEPRDVPQDNVALHHSHLTEEEYSKEETEESEIAISTNFASKKSTALLATAMVIVKGHRTTVLRALVDQGSQANFTDERAAQLLKTK